MIASSIAALGARPDDAQIAQPPSSMAADSRTSTRSRAGSAAVMRRRAGRSRAESAAGRRAGAPARPELDRTGAGQQPPGDGRPGRDGRAARRRRVRRAVTSARRRIAAGRRPARRAVARPRPRHAGATPSASRSRRPSPVDADQSPTTVVPWTAAVTWAAVVERRARRARARRSRVGRGHDPRGEGQAGPGRRGRPRPGSSGRPHGGQRRRSASPAGSRRRPPSGSYQPRSTRLADAAAARARAGRAPPIGQRRAVGRSTAEVRQLGVELGIVERRRQRRLPVARRLARPALAPRGGRRGRDLAMGAGQPGQGPGARHDPVRVVATAARRQPATAGVAMGEAVDQAGRLAHRGRRDVQVGQRIPGMRVRAVLGHDDVRPERGGQLGEQRADDGDPGRRRRSRPGAGR